MNYDLDYERDFKNVVWLMLSDCFFPLFFPVVYVFPTVIIKCMEGHINASSNVNDQVPRSAPDKELPWERDLNL